MNKLELPKEIGWRDHAIGGGIGAAYVAWLLATARSLGFARDEGFYFHAATSYARWFDVLFTDPHQAMDKGFIDGIWGENHEHPSLMKSLFALSWKYFHEKWHLFADASTSFRFPAMVMSGVALWVTYLFAARAFSRRAGVLAAVLLALMPRVFYNSHLACFDAPIMAMWIACIYVYWRSVQSGGLGWAIWSGVMYGLTLDTKHNAWILPAVFIPHALFASRRKLARGLRAGTLPIPASILAMATIGPLVFYALWPWLWSDTLPRVSEYVSFHMNHVYYNMEFLHKNYFGPPSPTMYAPVMIAATVPAVTLLLFGIGAFDRLKALALRAFAWIQKQRDKEAPAAEKGDRAETDLLLFLSFAAPIAVFFLPKTPIFGGTKHWLPAYPFLAIFAGRGFDRVATRMQQTLSPWLRSKQQELGAAVALGALVVLPPLLVTEHSHPFGLSSYVPIVGGTAGGADLGLNRQFWGFTTQSLAPYFDKLPPHARVFIHDTAWDSFYRMTQEHRIRPDLQPVGSPSEAQVGLVHHELHMNEVDFQEWVAFETTAPDYVLVHDGVPIVSVYRRK
jgi:4-amino-4-deoxy-L-arabinose transferase-like glycosyltransferase